MHEVAEVHDELPEGALVARVVELRGFGSRQAGEAVALTSDGVVLAGRILAGLADRPLAGHLRADGDVGVVAVEVTDPDAEAAGMACGGHARLLLQRVDTIDIVGWRALAGRRPVVLATDLASAETRIITDDGVTVGSVGDDDTVDHIARGLLRSGRSTSVVDDHVLIESFLPPTTVRIVGQAAVGDALAAQAELLGWHHETVDGADEAVAAAEAQASHDALVVLSHDEDVDTPSLAAALRHGRGYVGALGSRGTQAARRERLAAEGFTTTQLAADPRPRRPRPRQSHPAETAVAIVAEIIAHRSGRAATSLTAATADQRLTVDAGPGLSGCPSPGTPRRAGPRPDRLRPRWPPPHSRSRTSMRVGVGHLADVAAQRLHLAVERVGDVDVGVGIAVRRP